MQSISLNGSWQLTGGGFNCRGSIPGSVYSILLENSLIEDPFYRDNELAAFDLMEEDYTFTRRFDAGEELLRCKQVLLRCDGLDTICTLRLNGREIGAANNMHRVWEYDITAGLHAGENVLELHFTSPNRWIREAFEKDPIGGSWDAQDGFPHLRKAHCMFGWDWGPRLPDAGVWRDITLLGIEGARIKNFILRQRHEADGRVLVYADAECTGEGTCAFTLEGPENGEIPGNVPGKIRLPAGQWTEVPNPQLWWPNGYGGQPLYTVTAVLTDDALARETDRQTKRIGLRAMTMARHKDEWGESFAHSVNGMEFFAMGADYIPEDNIFSRITPQRTRQLLQQCVKANFNVIRVWGGGYYPDDFFYDICDELGLVVWQDFLFACANYRLTPEFEENIRQEFMDNIRRLRHHASLGLWCGNNEMEMFQLVGEYDGDWETKADYIRMFEHILPEVLRAEDPDTFYWPASPSSGGHFDEPNAPDRGDVHYWEVWHGGKPFDEYRKYFFRYASEFGFQSFPDYKTIESFTLPEERNVFSRTMEMHQRNQGANGKILSYLAKTYLYPAQFETLVYASQMLQGEAIQYGVEHWRRNRGRCMGAVYWQLNDIWPVASWASIDYFGRWKALHYFARRFFAPVLLSCEETGETTTRPFVIMQKSPVECSARFSVANETRRPFTGKVKWRLCGAGSAVCKEGSFAVQVPPLTSLWLDKLVFEGCDFLEQHAFFELLDDAGGTVSQGSVLFTAPKHYHFQNPALSCTANGKTITVTAAAYAKGVEIYSPDSDFVLSDNFFDMEAGSRTVVIEEGAPKTLRVRSVYDIGRDG